MRTLSLRILRALTLVVALAILAVPALRAQDSRLMNLPTEGRTLTVGSEEFGRIDQGDPIHEGRYVQAWALDLRSGQTVQIDHISEDLDSYLMIVGPGLDEVLRDDDGGPGSLDSQILFTAPATGRYRVIATALGSGVTGSYTLRVAGGVGLESLQTEGRVLSVGDVAYGRLDEGDAVHEGKYVQAWALDLSAGQRVTIDHISEDLDSYLYVVGPGLGDPLRDDDGGDGSLDSRITFTAPQTGRFRVIASTYGAGATGSYTLEVRGSGGGGVSATLEGVPTMGRVLATGRSVFSRLDEGDTRYDGKYVEAWALDLRAGQEVTIEHISEDLDSYLYVVGPGLSQPLRDDDGADGPLDSRITFTAPMSGQYRVIASSWGSRTTGEYELWVMSDEPLTGEAARRQALLNLPTHGRTLTVGSEEISRLDTGDDRWENKYVESWALELRRGQEVTVDHISEDFDSYLYIVGPGMNNILSNDDGAGSLDSRITFTAPTAGQYRVIATHFGTDRTGAYTLVVWSGEPMDDSTMRQALSDLLTDRRLP